MDNFLSNCQVIACSAAIADLPGLESVLGCPIQRDVRFVSSGNLRAVVLAWGRKPSALKAEKFAKKKNLSICYLEDGFLRSVNFGPKEQALSLVMDNLGIYYDATAPSRLEGLIETDLSIDQKKRAGDLVAAWRQARVSKYNHSREYAGALPSRYVLVADQTLGDASIRYGLANEASFSRMLDAALAENPDCAVVLKVHPEVMAGRKHGHYDLAILADNRRIYVLGEDVHPVSLIERAEAVYVVTSQMGFEGLVWGKRVRTFGMPFYAGWGLTEDELPAPGRRRPVALENLVHAALVTYPRYVDPETGHRCEPEQVIAYLAHQRRMRDRFPPVMYALGFSSWKKPIVSAFFQGSHVHFVRKVRKVPAGARLIIWGRKTCKEMLRPDISPVYLEDGFIRSVGLGAELVRPLSWVVDCEGIYYDATTLSGLETILQNAVLDAELQERARRLRLAILENGISKYNISGKDWKRPTQVAKVILVPGQVETDASIRFGASLIRRNVDLLRAVREKNPEAYVLYKPHPDVSAGLRAKGQDEQDAATWCDEVLEGVEINGLLEQVDEVHVLTSLAGFEALMRNRRVVTYGQPFYSGWGLTQDMFPIARRTRRLSLDELVAGTLILYPTYVSRITGKFTTPEQALRELVTWRTEGPKRRSLLRKLVARIFRKE